MGEGAKGALASIVARIAIARFSYANRRGVW
jgi:hypothetical protein